MPIKQPSKKRGRGDLPYMGIRHGVLGTQSVENMFLRLDQAFDRVAPEIAVPTRRGYDYEPQYRLTGRRHCHITVVEGAPVYKQLESNRQWLETHDIGRIRGRIENAISGYVSIAPDPHTILLSRLETVGYEDEEDGQLTIAAIATHDTEGAQIVHWERRAAEEVLSTEVPGYTGYGRARSSGWLMHMVVARFAPGTPRDTVTECVRAGNALLRQRPAQASLGRLSIFPPAEPQL